MSEWLRIQEITIHELWLNPANITYTDIQCTFKNCILLSI